MKNALYVFVLLLACGMIFAQVDEDRYLYTSPFVVHSNDLHIFTSIIVTNTGVERFESDCGLVQPCSPQDSTEFVENEITISFVGLDGTVVRDAVFELGPRETIQKQTGDFGFNSTWQGSVWIESDAPIVANSFGFQFDTGALESLGFAQLALVHEPE